MSNPNSSEGLPGSAGAQRPATGGAPGAGSDAPALPYPPAEASQSDVVASRELFAATLASVHAYFGIAEKLPRVGGRELDLYELYRNVTALGGCEKVIQRKLWRDAALSFNFPDTITSVSFSLRKAYLTFLWDYEQVLFWRNAGPRLPPPQGPAVGLFGAGSGAAGAAAGDGAAPARSHKKKRGAGDAVVTAFVGLLPGTPIQLTAAARVASEPEAGMVGAKGVVTLDARFDAGYFVTVRVNRQEFKGLLYYPPPDHTQDPLQSATRKVRRRGEVELEGDENCAKRRDKVLFLRPKLEPAFGSERARDPGAPRPNKTPFNFFSADARGRVREAFPHLSQTELTKKVGELWQRASEEEKVPYAALAADDKLRYQAELEAYNYKLAAQASAQQAAQKAVQVQAAQADLATHPLPSLLPGPSLRSVAEPGTTVGAEAAPVTAHGSDAGEAAPVHMLGVYCGAGAEGRFGTALPGLGHAPGLHPVLHHGALAHGAGPGGPAALHGGGCQAPELSHSDAGQGPRQAPGPAAGQAMHA